jgi:hypothetical protein
MNVKQHPSASCAERTHQLEDIAGMTLGAGPAILRFFGLFRLSGSSKHLSPETLGCRTCDIAIL